MRLAILGSTRGTLLTPIISAIKEHKLSAQIAVVISNKKESGILARAQENGLANEFLDPMNLTPIAYDKKLSALLKQYAIELIVLIGYMRILSREFVEEWRNQIINVHPSLLPDFAGGMDKSVHQAVLDGGKKETGCTVHYVTEIVDAGPILIQKKCPVLKTDTVETLKERVQTLESEAIIEAISLCMNK